jgi:basic amino acid/polyamine antiporter, APA family
MPQSVQTLRREIGVFGATMLGLGAMLGTGVFVSIGIAAGIAGTWIVLAIVLAAGLAACNALSSAQLAAAHPVSGGTYEYGYRLLNPALGFTAGWLFLLAKSASAAAAALGAVGYFCHLIGVAPGVWLGPLAALVALTVTALVVSGLRRSNSVNVVIVSLTVLALLVFVGYGMTHLLQQTGPRLISAAPTDPVSIGAVLYATALMFVAYTGYGRIATLGEEVCEPAATIPRAIVFTLIITASLYLLVAVAALGAVSPAVLASSAADRAVPLETAAAAIDGPVLTVLVAAGAVTAMLGVLLNLVLGLSRVVLAMGRRGDLPRALGTLDADDSPRAAVVLVGTIIAAIAAVGAIQATWAFSALTVLVYYALTNLAALRLPAAQRRYPAAIAWVGLIACLALTPFVPGSIWVAGGGLVLAGFFVRWFSRHR